MKHKIDAKEEAEKVISLHMKAGKIDRNLAIISALITINYSQTRNDSLKTRTLNYLKYLHLGDEITLKLNSLETQLNKEYYNFNNFETLENRELSKIKINKIKKEISEIIIY